MAEKDVERRVMLVNRAPVLMLWAVVVAEVLGFEHDESADPRAGGDGA